MCHTMALITRLSGNKNRIKGPFFHGYDFINVGKHAETESFFFKRKHSSEICSEQILTRVNIYLHQMGHRGKL